MKDIRLALRAILLGDATIASLVGSRIFPGILPQGITDTSIVQNLITETISYDMLGASGIIQSRIQLDCWSQTQNAAVELGSAVYNVLSGFKGTVQYGSNSPKETITIQAIFHDTGRDDYDNASKMFSRRRDYLIWFEDV